MTSQRPRETQLTRLCVKYKPLCYKRLQETVWIYGAEPFAEALSPCYGLAGWWVLDSCFLNPSTTCKNLWQPDALQMLQPIHCI